MFLSTGLFSLGCDSNECGIDQEENRSVMRIDRFFGVKRAFFALFCVRWHEKSRLQATPEDSKRVRIYALVRIFVLAAVFCICRFSFLHIARKKDGTSVLQYERLAITSKK